MDCLADLLSQKGMEGTHAWCEKGLKLRCRGSADSSNWIVIGQLPEEEGEGVTAIAFPSDCMAEECAVLVRLNCSMSLVGRYCVYDVMPLMTCSCSYARHWPHIKR